MADTTVKILSVRADIGDAQQKLGKLQLSVKKLGDERRKLNKDLKSGKITEQQYTKAIAENTIATKKAQIGVKKYKDQILIANGVMKKSSGFVMGIRKALTGLAAQFLAFTAVIAVIRDVVGVFKDFEQANADLSAVLGVTKEEMIALTEDAKRLGATTAFTATEVSGLQKEYAKLGFTQEEILNVTESTLDLAAATGTDLARSAEVAGATLRAFNLDSSEMDRVVNVMAKSFSSSSLDMEKFATSMRAVAPVAKNAGLDIETTTAMLGTLTDRGIDASTAGTSLRNVFLELSKKGMTYEEAMAKINSATDKNKVAMELFGKRGAVTGTILAETAEDVATLEEKLNNTGEAAKEMAEKQLDTLDGSLTILRSAWEGFILSLEDGGGFLADVLKVIVQDISKGLSVLSGTAENTGDNFSVLGTMVESLKFQFRLITVPLRELWDLLVRVTKAVAERMTPHIERISQVLADKFAPQIERITNFMNDKVLPIFSKVADTVEKVMRAVLTFGESALSKLGIEIDLSNKAMSMFNEIIGKNTEKVEENTEAVEEGNKEKKKTRIINEQTIESEKELTKEEQKELEKRENQREKAAEKLAALRAKMREQIKKLEAEAIEDEREREKAQAKLDFENKINRITTEGEVESQLKITLKDKLNTDLAAIDEKYKKEAEEKAKKEAEEELKREFNEKKFKVDTAKDTLDILKTLDDAALANRLKNVEQGSKQEEAILRAASIRRKAMAIAEVGINLAKEISAINYNAALNPANAVTFGGAGVSQSSILTAIAVGRAAAQIAAIAAQKFALGGVLKGKSHARGGIPTIDGQYEFEGGEAVINKRSTARYGALLSQINQAGGGVAFEKGGLTKFQEGGISAPAMTLADIGDNGANDISQDITSQMGAIKVVNVVTDTMEAQNSVLNVQSEAEIG